MSNEKCKMRQNGGPRWHLVSPGGRTMVARGFQPLEIEYPSRWFSPGGRTMVARGFQPLETEYPSRWFSPGGRAMVARGFQPLVQRPATPSHSSEWTNGA